MNEKYANAILNSVISVLGIMAQIPITPRTPEEKSDTQSRGEVTGLIEISGEKVKGSASVSFSRGIILELCKRMLRIETNEIDDAAQDLAKEMANMFIGNAKSEMDDKGYYADMSIPHLYMGPSHEIPHKSHTSTTLIPIETEYGDMWIELCLTN